MDGVLVTDATVGVVRVGVDRFGVVGHHVRQEALDRRAGGVGSHAKSDATTTLDRAEHGRLVVAPLLRSPLLGAGSVLPVAGLAADVGFVGLHDPRQERRAPDEHLASLELAIADFEQWQTENPSLVKAPD